MGRSCSKCGVILTSENWRPSDKNRKYRHYRCRACTRKRTKKYYDTNKERILERVRTYRRKYIVITVGNKRIKGIKRDYTGYCELCNTTEFRKLDYHHWNDNNLSKGMWLCTRCHKGVEFVDKLGNKYLTLRKTIEGD